MMLPKSDMCTGCGACSAACPKDCIRMKADAEGFLYPRIDLTRCVDCRKCEKVCPVVHKPETVGDPQFYAAKNLDSDVRQQSSSGGVFTALAAAVLQKGGAVCAAVYNEEYAVEHRIAYTVEELASMRGAKYSQSHAGHLFRQLKELLNGSTPVMFVGTPCQCAGLKAYLGREYEHLLLVDMICHGVPAPTAWKNYVNQREKTDSDGSRIASIDQRDKSTGWSSYAYSVTFRYANGNVYSVHQGADPYMKGFVGDLYLRPSCSGCSFKGVSRCSDLTMGDCWGIWDSHPEFDDNKGTSLLLIQSEKGQQMWECIKGGFSVVTLSAAEAVRSNPSAVVSAEAHPRREEFFSRLAEGEPLDTLVEELLTPKRQSLIKRILMRIFLKRDKETFMDGGR